VVYNTPINHLSCSLIAADVVAGWRTYSRRVCRRPRNSRHYFDATAQPCGGGGGGESALFRSDGGDKTVEY